MEIRQIIISTDDGYSIYQSINNGRWAQLLINERYLFETLDKACFATRYEGPDWTTLDLPRLEGKMYVVAERSWTL